MIRRYKRYITDHIFNEWEEMRLSFEELEQLDKIIEFLEECKIASLQTQKV